MGIWKSIVGPSKSESWGLFAQEIGATYQPGTLFKSDIFKYSYKNWNFYFDTYTQSTGKTHSVLTRLSVPFLTKDELELTIYEEGFFSSIGKLFKMQDIQINDSTFNDKYIIKGNNDMKTMQLLSEPTLRQRFFDLKGANVKVDKGGGLFQKNYPPKVNILYFECYGIIKDQESLKALFSLFQALLDGLVRINSIENENPSYRIS